MYYELFCVSKKVRHSGQDNKKTILKKYSVEIICFEPSM